MNIAHCKMCLFNISYCNNFVLNTFQAQNNICLPHLSEVNFKSFRTLYPILDDYSSSEFSILAQKNNIEMSTLQLSERAKNGVRRVIMLKIVFLEKKYL